MNDYHSYVFDEKNRRFVGRFEEMYQAEREKGFDSWQQDDVRNLDKQICLHILGQYNFNTIIDVGCGKGSLTQFLKKANNHVVGIDFSKTAIQRAKIRYPDIKFECRDVTKYGWIKKLRKGTDIIICLEVLSYISNWPQLIENFSIIGRYTLVKLFVPENPIGYIKSFDDLYDVFIKHFDILEDVRLLKRKQVILFGKSLNFSKKVEKE